jgi:hypothetical protein
LQHALAGRPGSQDVSIGVKAASSRDDAIGFLDSREAYRNYRPTTPPAMGDLTLAGIDDSVGPSGFRRIVLQVAKGNWGLSVGVYGPVDFATFDNAGRWMAQMLSRLP